MNRIILRPIQFPIFNFQFLISSIAFLIFNFQFIIPSDAQVYFQQEVNYKIDVSLNDRKNELNAFESITYKNNSPTALSEIYFHLWANAYKNRETALCKQMVSIGDTKLFFATDEERGYIDSLNFKVNGQPILWQLDSANIDICKLILPEKLEPGKEIIITTPFHVKIPSATFSRLGHLGQAYMITQWYPKPAVFDPLGWHAMPYLQLGEFYSEFGSYEVNITLPKNYVVGATGDLQNTDELKWLDEKVEATSKIASFSNDMSFPESDRQTKTITYKQNNVHDFAWFADKRYHVLKGELILPNTKKKVTLWSMFTNSEAELWKHSIEYIHDGAYYYSLWNGDYLYNQITAVDGTISAGTGMEYPNITVIGKSERPFLLEIVIVHEVGHNWFYGMLGSNERDHGWMDEGINSYYEMRYALAKYPPEKFGNKNEIMGYGKISSVLDADKFDYKQMSMNEYLFTGRTWNDQPIDITSTDFTETNYGTILYKKTAVAFDYLRTFLGEELFDKCMKEYFSQWQLKHPYPDDVKRIFEETSQQNLDWFFNDILKTSKKLDYKICKAKKNPDATYTLTIANKGTTISPLTITGLKDKKVIGTTFVKGFEKKSKVNFAAGDYDQIVIGNNYDIPDINMKNNFIRTSGILKKWEPIQFKFITGIERPQYAQIYYSPVIGWNDYNKWMIGVAFHNRGIVPKKFEYLLMPMYSFNAKDIAGNANVSYNYFRNEKFSTAFSIGLSHYAIGKQTNYNAEPNESFLYSYTKIEPDIKFAFRKNARSLVRQQILLKNYFISSNSDFVFDSIKTEQHTVNEYYNEVIYALSNNRSIDPYSLNGSLQTGKDYMKAAVEAQYHFTYKKRQKGISLRLFAGSFLYNKSDKNVNFKMSGFYGVDDYLFNDIYLGRTETDNSKTASRQFTEGDGAFKINTAVGQTDTWLIAFNIKATMPGLPIMFYMDMGTYENAKNAFEGSQALMYNGGLAIWIIRDVAEIYFPLFYSSDIKNNLETNNINSLGERIRFQLNFNLVNPLKLQRQIFN
ncbi:MAG: M1 family metallopeptidase [Bacteroidia bacterium]